MRELTRDNMEDLEMSDLVIWYENKVLLANLNTFDFEDDYIYTIVDFDTKSIYKGTPIFADESDRIFADDIELIGFKQIKD